MEPQQLQEVEPTSAGSTRPGGMPGATGPQADLDAMSAAMRQLQDLIDDFLDRPQPSRSDAPDPDRTEDPQPDTDSDTDSDTDTDSDGDTDTAPNGDDAGWGRAIAVRSRTDPQRVWIEANAALRRGEHAKAFELFRSEAETAAAGDDHSRAAIAYRMASDAAAAMGRRDDSDHDLRRAGKQYLFVAENPSSSLQTMYSSYLAASRCFLAVGNLELTQSCVARAIDLQQAINEDLHARFNSGPVTGATAR
jgi:tetratricopeptide (TPR) repeat protein